MKSLALLVCLIAHITCSWASFSWNEVEEEYNSAVKRSQQVDWDGDGELETDNDSEPEESPGKTSSFASAKDSLFLASLSFFHSTSASCTTPQWSVYKFSYSFIFSNEILQPPEA